MTNSVVFDRNTTTKIHAAVDRLCVKMGEPKDVITDFREEMITNIMASVEELVHNGHPHQEAVELAIQRFGETGSVVSELSEIYRVQRIFARWLLILTVTIGFLGVMCLSFYSIVNSRIVPYYDNEITSTVGKMISHENIQSTIPLTLESRVQKLVDKTPYVTGVGMSILKANTPPNQSPFQFVYPKSLEHIETNGIFLPMLGQSLFTHLAPTMGAYYDIPGTTKVLFVEVVGLHCSFEVATIGIALFFLYWVLFSVWGIMNAIYNRKFKIWWGLSIIIFNVLGYLIYALCVRRSKSI